MNIEIQKPSEWEKDTGVHVMDLCGWEQDGDQYEIPISREEFLSRCCSSRCSWPREIIDEALKQTKI